MKNKTKTIYIIAGILFLIGVICIGIKAISKEYVDASGLLHEKFFLLPIGFFFMFSGIVTFIVAIIKNIITKNKK